MNSTTLDSLDWLKDDARHSTIDEQSAEFFASLPKLTSKQRKKNRHLPRIKSKKQRQKLTADVVALESALQLISQYGDKYRKS